MTKALFATAALAAVVISAQAQVEVVDSAPQSGSASGAQNQSPAEGVGMDNPQTRLFYQMQALQQEVMELRGQVEEQAYEIKQLKQKRMEDYLDLDRRISALSEGGVAAAPSEDAPVTGTASGDASVVQTGSASDDEAGAYGKAYDLLKQRKIDQSIEAFKSHLDSYPDGEYAGNSYYWLGEIYLLKNDLPKAQQWFSDLLADFPDSRKVMDAKFKLGKVYHLQGQNDRAKQMLGEVANSGADAAQLADQYLKENF